MGFFSFLTDGKSNSELRLAHSMFSEICHILCYVCIDRKPHSFIIHIWCSASYLNILHTRRLCELHWKIWKQETVPIGHWSLHIRPLRQSVDCNASCQIIKAASIGHTRGLGIVMPPPNSTYPALSALISPSPQFHIFSPLTAPSPSTVTTFPHSKSLNLYKEFTQYYNFPCP